MRAKIFRWAAILLPLCLAGCAADLAQHDVDWRSGAKHGWISGFYTADTPSSDLPKCLADLPPEQLAAHRFVKIDYRHVRRMLVEVAELPDTAERPAVRIGDRVDLWPQDCAEGRISRISKMMAAPAK